MLARCLRIVLTGGPGGGKSTVMRELRAEDPRAERWLMVPEAAPFLFQTVLDGRDKRFQRAVVRLQVGIEDACTEAAHPGQVLLCHRGTLDPLAYWLYHGWDEREFFEVTETNCVDHWNRYDGVVHLQTAAIRAERYYLRWPDAHRPESKEQAREIDVLCGKAWSGHPCYVLITNDDRGWEDKARTARDVLERWVHYHAMDCAKGAT